MKREKRKLKKIQNLTVWGEKKKKKAGLTQEKFLNQLKT